MALPCWFNIKYQTRILELEHINSYLAKSINLAPNFKARELAAAYYESLAGISVIRIKINSI